MAIALWLVAALQGFGVLEIIHGAAKRPASADPGAVVFGVLIGAATTVVLVLAAIQWAPS